MIERKIYKKSVIPAADVQVLVIADIGANLMKVSLNVMAGVWIEIQRAQCRPVLPKIRVSRCSLG
jgi:hypothetical protein